METLFIIFWVFTLIVCWIASTSTVVNGEHNITAFRIKTFFFWLSVITTFFASRYLI